METKPHISLIIPVFNEQENIRNLYDRLVNVVEKISDQYRFEFLFTDNHSTDDTFMILKDLAAKDKRIKVIRFTKKNFVPF